MRIKILLLGDDPVSLVSDGQLLKDRGMMVYTAFNLDNVNDLINEVKPDLVFFDPHKQSKEITEAYNNLVNGIYYTNIPVIYTLSDDDVYLVTRKRTESKDKRTIIADSIIEAIKMAMRNNKTYQKKAIKDDHQTINISSVNARA